MTDPSVGGETTNTKGEVKGKQQTSKFADWLNQLSRNKAVPAILIIIGLLIILYPVVSTQWNNWQQNRAAAEYAELQKGVPPEIINKQWEDAHRYNSERASGPILDPWISRFVPDNQDYIDYLATLNAQEAMARLIIPSIKSDLPVYHGTEGDTLQKGVGHLFGTDLPVGGPGTHSVLTAHTGLSTATLFDNLKDVKKGDAFFIQVAGHKLKYQVDQIKTVLPHEVESLRAEAGKDYVTLVTCTPYGINTHRLLVRGHQVPISEEEAAALDETEGVVWQWWMYLLSAMFVLGLSGLIWWYVRQARNSSEENQENFGDTVADSDHNYEEDL